MNINDLYAIIPEDMHGSIAVSSGAVSITQDGDNPPFVMFKATTGDNSDLVFNEADLPQITDNPAPRIVADPDAVPATELQAVDPAPSPTPADIAPAQKLSVFQLISKWLTR